MLVTGGDVRPVFGQAEQLVDQMSLVIGGSAAITAVAAARLGLRVELVAAVGDDNAGDFMLRQLAAANVGTAGVVIRSGLPTGMTVALSAGADRAILTATGALASLTPGDVPAGLLARARHVHVSSYFLVAERLGPGLAALLAAARDAGAVTSLDTNWDPSGRWHDEYLPAILAQSGLLLPNEAEALRLAGQPTLAAAAGVLAGYGAGVVVKLGERGALVAGARERVHLPPVRPVDTTGAGDCFNAGLIAGLLRGMPLPEAAALGCAAGALSTRAPGGTAASPDLESALALARTAAVSRC